MSNCRNTCETLRCFSDYDLEESLRTMVEAYFPIVESVKNADPHPYYRHNIDNLVSPSFIFVSNLKKHCHKKP